MPSYYSEQQTVNVLRATGKHAVRYLGEFAYRLNRRCQESNLFTMLLETCTKVQTMTYPQLKAAEVH